MNPIEELPEKTSNCQYRKDRNRKRSKRRAIHCPIHGCHLESTSPKYALYADKVEHLQQRGMGRYRAMTVVASRGTVALSGEWLEAFWCPECQAQDWYHVRREDSGLYKVLSVPQELWKQAIGVIQPEGNPSVGEFTRRQAKALSFQGIKDYSRLS
jgi:hypothetical protein